MMDKSVKDRIKWSQHWSNLDTVARVRSSFLSMIRKKVIAKSVGKFIEHHFSPQGVYLHAGSGTAESDLFINKYNRRFIAVDLVQKPLLVARNQPNSYVCVVADIKHLALKDQCVDGIWNVGVHEHFSPQENGIIFKEFLRVLKPKGKLIVFWPGMFTPFMLLKDGLEFLWRLYRPGFRFFPEEINKARSKSHIRSGLESAGFRILSISLSQWDLFVFYAAVAEKP